MYLNITDSKFGLDTRRFMLNAPPGTLSTLTNGHVTPGGEIEKRKAFAFTAFTEGTPDTFGLEVTSAGFVTFGSKAEGSLTDTLPDDVTYVQLAHPDGTSAMVGVIHSTVYNGAAFVIADYGAGGIISWYDGEIVDDLSPGKLALILADAEALAAYIAEKVNATGNYTATVSGSTVTVEGQEGVTFAVSVANNSVCTEPIPHTHGAATVADLTLGQAPDDRFYCTVDGVELIDEAAKIGDPAAATTYDLIAYATNALRATSAVLYDGGSGLGGANYNLGDILVTRVPGVVIKVEVTGVDGLGAITSFTILQAGRVPSGYGSVGSGNYFELVYPNPTWSGSTGSSAFLDVTLGAAPDILIEDGSVLVFKTKDIFGSQNNTVSWTLDVTYADAAVFYASGGTNTSASSPITTADNLPAYYDTGTVTLGGAEPTIETSLVSNGVTSFSGTIPQTQFQVIAVNASGSGVVTSITIGGDEVLTDTSLARSGTNYDTPALLATAIKTQVNTYCTANNKNYSASVVNNTVVIRATNPAEYASKTGATVIVTVDDDVCIGNCAITFSRASAVSTPTWTSLLADSADILGSTVPAGAWVDLTTAVAELATTINAFSSAYTAVASGSTLYISKLATSSSDTALQVQPAGTDLNWVFTNPGGGNTGVSGGVFPGTIDANRTDTALRFVRTNNYASDVVQVVPGGGSPPYIYQWELVSGSPDAFGRGTLLNGLQGALLGSIRIESPVAPATKFVFSGALYQTTNVTAKYRCKLTDSLNRVGYSPTINVHYP